MSVSNLLKKNDLELFAEKLTVKNLVPQGDINISGANGDILYINNNQLNKLPIGAQDEVLKVSAGGVPEWGVGGGGGGGPATQLATDSIGPITINTNDPTAVGDTLVYNGLGQAVWQQPSAQPAIELATDSIGPIVINTNDPTALGDTLVYNGLGQAVWQQPLAQPATQLKTQNDLILTITGEPQNAFDYLAFENGNELRWQSNPSVEYQTVYDNNSSCIQSRPDAFFVQKNINQPYADEVLKYAYDTQIYNNSSSNVNMGVHNAFVQPLLNSNDIQHCYKNYISNSGSVNGAMSAISIDGDRDFTVYKVGLHAYEDCGVFTQYVPKPDIPEGDQFLVNAIPVPLATASSTSWFVNNGDIIQISYNEKFSGIDLTFIDFASSSMFFIVRYDDGTGNFLQASYVDKTNGLQQNGKIIWNLQNSGFEFWKPNGGFYNVRIERSDAGAFSTFPRLADNGLKVFSRGNYGWDYQGNIVGKGVFLDQGMTLGKAVIDRQYTLPNQLGTIGSSNQRQNFMLITDNDGDMIFRQSPYLYSSTLPSLNQPIGLVSTSITTPVIDPNINGSLTVPANAFFDGNSFLVRMGGQVSFVAGQVIQISIIAIDDLLAEQTLGVISFTSQASTLQPWTLDGDFHIVNIAGGIATVATTIKFGYQPNPSPQPQPFASFGSSSGTNAVNTLVNQTLAVRIQSNGAGGTISTFTMSIGKKF